MGVDNIDNVTVNASQAAPAAPQNQKNPVLAAICSFLFPGLGQLYNGEGFFKGLLYLVGTLIGLIILFIPGVAIWLYGIYNAYKGAQNVNQGLVPYTEVNAVNLIIYIVLTLVVYVIAFFILSMIVAAFVFAMVGSTYSY